MRENRSLEGLCDRLKLDKREEGRSRPRNALRIVPSQDDAVKEQNKERIGWETSFAAKPSFKIVAHVRGGRCEKCVPHSVSGGCKDKKLQIDMWYWG